MKMKTSKGLLLVLPVLGILAFSPRAEAVNEQWKYLGTNEDAERFFYDSGSVIYLPGNIVNVWVKELSREPVRKLEEIRCPDKVIRSLQVISEGQRISPSRLRDYYGWRLMEQSPPMLELYKALCR